jgi:hypothetical protein
MWSKHHGLTGASALTGPCSTLARVQCGPSSIGSGNCWGYLSYGSMAAWLAVHAALLTYASWMAVYAVKQVPVPGFNLHSLAGEFASVLGLDGAWSGGHR